MKSDDDRASEMVSAGLLSGISGSLVGALMAYQSGRGIWEVAPILGFGIGMGAGVYLGNGSRGCWLVNSAIATLAVAFVASALDDGASETFLAPFFALSLTIGVENLMSGVN